MVLDGRLGFDLDILFANGFGLMLMRRRAAIARRRRERGLLREEGEEVRYNYIGESQR